MALPLDKEESLEEKYKHHLEEHAALPIFAESVQSYSQTPVILNSSHQNSPTYLRPPASSSYSSIIPELKPSGNYPTIGTDFHVTEEELAQIRAAEAASIASMPKPVERKLTGRDICKNIIQPEQEKDYQELKKYGKQQRIKVC